MYKTSVIALKLFVDVMQQLVIVQSIIVERNLHSYYRLPTTALRRGNSTDEYFILQCPFKSTLDIPKPKDMDICMIVGRYASNHERDEKQKPVIEEAVARSKTNLHTNVDYRHIKPHKRVKWVKLKKVRPYKMMVKPFKKKEFYKRPKTEIKEQFKATNVRVFLDNPKATSQTKISGNRKPAYGHDSIALSSSVKPKVVKKSEVIQPNTDDDIIDELDVDEDSVSSLKYLGAKNVLDKLKLQHRPTSNDTLETSEKFLAESNKYKKGFKTKGYQNMYHRDEIYQDHIFYDDLQQTGNYGVYKKSKESR